MVRYGFSIKTRHGQRVENIHIMAGSQDDAERRLRQMYHHCEILECREQAALGPDLLAREEIQLRPGDTQRLSRDVAAGTRAVGVIVAYRDLERSNWRAVLLLPDPDVALLRIPGRAVEVPLRVRLGARAVALDKP